MENTVSTKIDENGHKTFYTELDDDITTDQIKERLQSITNRIKQQTTENNMEHEFRVIEKDKLTENHIFVISVDIGKLPPQKAKQHLDDIMSQFRPLIPKTIQMVVLPKGKIDIQIIEKE
jgi:polyhydroxyalkanoate synthesis regulator phasin